MVIRNEDLIEFVREFGPVAAANVEEIKPELDGPGGAKDSESTFICAIEELSSLRRERQIYAASNPGRSCWISIHVFLKGRIAHVLQS